MKVLTVRIDDQQYERLAAIARAREISLSDLTRSAMAALTDIPDNEDDDYSPRRAETPESLSVVTRRQLALLHRILAKLVDGNDEDGDSKDQILSAEALERGYVVEYNQEFITIEPELSTRDTDFVMDVLDMFMWLERSYEHLSVDDRDSLDAGVERRVRYQGFDFNDRHEIRLHAYAKRLIDEGKWEPLAVYFDKDHERGNSHMPRIALYERMLSAFKPMWAEKTRSAFGARHSYLLSAAEIKAVTDEAVHPSNR